MIQLLAIIMFIYIFFIGIYYLVTIKINVVLINFIILLVFNTACISLFLVLFYEKLPFGGDFPLVFPLMLTSPPVGYIIFLFSKRWTSINRMNYKENNELNVMSVKDL